ncbi:MAG: phosphotransferase, partial [Planctomycetaceae bacterium]|nr:phosphotransferase [Planctomycetaceae bacterium]
MNCSTPQILSEITPEWLTAVLRSAGYRNTRVQSFEADRIGSETGFSSEIFRLSWNDSAQSPASCIVKLPLPGGSQTEKICREAAFYACLAPQAGISVPRCYSAAEEKGEILVLEDLKDCRFGDESQSCSLREAEAAVDALTGLHARWWNHPQLCAYQWLPRYGNVLSQLEKLPQRRETFFQNYGKVLQHESLELAGALNTRHESVFHRLQQAPETLLHTDSHLDNLAFRDVEDRVEVILFDWQNVSRGPAVVDLALFLVSAWTQSCDWEQTAIVKRYHASLSSQGGIDYSFDQFDIDFRIALLRWWIGT